MSGEKKQYLEQVAALKDELSELLDGMDYCLDWKDSEEEWSIREVVCHLLDTPPGGMATVLKRVLEGSRDEIVIHSSMTNLTPERKAKDLADLRQDLRELMEQVEASLSAVADSDLQDSTVPVHLVRADVKEERTAAGLVERALLGHWREHLGQIKGIRQALGFG